jgi:hypothetical protein
MVKCCVFFAVQTGFLNIIWIAPASKGLVFNLAFHVAVDRSIISYIHNNISVLSMKKPHPN